MDILRRLFGQSGEESEEPEGIANAQNKIGETKASTSETVLSQNSDIRDSKTKNVDTASLAEVDEPESSEDDITYADGATRRLPLETVIASRNAHIQIGQSTDVGMVRNNNQDSMLTLYYSSRSSDNRPDFGLFIVADGMGGHHDGERASAIVTNTVVKHVISNIFLPMMSNSEDTDRPPVTESLTAAIQSANADVLSDVPDGGTTVTAVTVVGDLAYFAHVGDSRAYLITKDGIEQITRDHSLVQRLIELEQLTPEEAHDHPQQNVLYRAIGQSETLEVDALTRRLPPNSYLLLCSDGLWGLVDDEDILQVIRENPSPQTACDKLVALANTKGGKDNITAVMLHIPS